MSCLSNPGYCHCCRRRVEFIVEGNWLRDQYFCNNCRSTPRQRHLQRILDTIFSGWDKYLSIHESSPSNDFISQCARNYSSSQLLPDVEPGAHSKGIRSENLERLTFNDCTFDLFITQDVLEHVFRPDLATKEILRVLKPGGSHVFTTPKHGVGYTNQRAKLEGEEIVHISPELYHGNPVGDGRALVTWDYGVDFEFLLFKWCMCPTTTYQTRDRALGLDGEFLDVFVTRKAERV